MLTPMTDEATHWRSDARAWAHRLTDLMREIAEGNQDAMAELLRVYGAEVDRFRAMDPAPDVREDFDYFHSLLDMQANLPEYPTAMEWGLAITQSIRGLGLWALRHRSRRPRKAPSFTDV